MIGKYLNAIRGIRKIELYVAVIALCLAFLLVGGRGIFRTDSRKTELEIRLEHILEKIEGVKNVNVMIAMHAEGIPGGVVVIADGADDIMSYLRIQNTVKTLMDVELSQINIIAQP